MVTTAPSIAQISTAIGSFFHKRKGLFQVAIAYSERGEDGMSIDRPRVLNSGRRPPYVGQSGSAGASVRPAEVPASARQSRVREAARLDEVWKGPQPGDPAQASSAPR